MSAISVKPQESLDLSVNILRCNQVELVSIQSLEVLNFLEIKFDKLFNSFKEMFP